MHPVEISEYHLYPLDVVEIGADDHGKQVGVKQLYKQVPQTVWVSWSQLQLEFELVSSCSLRQWEPAPDRGFRPSGPRLSSPAEWGRCAAIVRRTWGQYVAVCSVSNSPVTHNQYQSFRNPFENKSVRGIFF